MKTGKHQRSEQRFQDLCWKVHDPALSLFCAHSMHELVSKTFLLFTFYARGKQLLRFVHGQGQKREQKYTTKNFVGFQNHFHSINYGILSGLLATRLLKV